ncbi:putative glycosyltransferase 7-like [Capsicum annuum]|uniref:uncharacterized protein LOC107861374 n=1 Tax=Capsicum annuum TaxID=4072 RepID=UPI0007BFAE8C|nr:uncharacterized protein LOC107861374 [Capsicum annuum]KAF3621957.1 putative glycosyltransferase 7-like [Capsicum annuum]
MKREEKRQKFHEGLLRMLYPPPPSPPSQEENDDEPLHLLEQRLNLDQIPDELEEDKGSSNDDDVESDHGPEKLTRAQRKRIRRKKLKEAASRRQNIIGPLFPTEESDDKGVNLSTSDEKPQGVRQNVNETDNAESCSKQNRLKQRRMAKRLVGGSSKSTGDGNKT